MKNIVARIPGILFVAGLLQLACGAQNFWQQTNGPYGGYVASMAVNSHLKLFAATSGGVSSSSDNGNTWAQTALNWSATGHLLLTSTDNIFVYTNTVLRSTDDGTTWTKADSGLTGAAYVMDMNRNANDDLFVLRSDSGIWRSTNGGRYWSRISVGTPSQPVSSMDIMKSTGDVYASSGKTVYRSMDKGNSWSVIYSGGSFSYPVTLLRVGPPGAIFAYCYNYLGPEMFRSTDAGANWTKVLADTTVSFLAFHPSNGTIFGGSTGGILRSTDNGTTWTKITKGLPALPKQLNAFAVNAQGGELFAAFSSTGIFRSSDNGTTWTPALNGMINAFIKCFTDDGLKKNLYAGTYERGAFRSSDNGNTWQQADTTGFDPYVNGLACNTKTNTLFAGTSTGVFRSSSSGAGWARAGFRDTTITALVMDSVRGALFAGTLLGGVFRTTDDGASWTHLTNGLSGSAYISVLALDQKKGILFAKSGNALYKSSDVGASWTATGSLPAGSIASLAVNQQSGAVFAGMNVAPIAPGLFRSTDEGGAWSRVDTSVMHGTILAVANDVNGQLYAGGSGGVFLSTNNGTSWMQANTGLSGPLTEALYFDGSSGYLFNGTYGNGAYRSTIVLPVELLSFTAARHGTRNELHWKTARETDNAGFAVERMIRSQNNETAEGFPAWEDIAFVPAAAAGAQQHEYAYRDETAALPSSAGTVIISYRLRQTDTDGTVHYSEIADVIVVQTQDGFYLSQNYPNPCDRSISIDFSLPRAGDVTLAVFDLSGRELGRLLDNRSLEAGTHTVAFTLSPDQSGAAINGVLFYRLSANGRTQTRKMLLLAPKLR